MREEEMVDFDYICYVPVNGAATEASTVPIGLSDSVQFVCVIHNGFGRHQSFCLNQLFLSGSLGILLSIAWINIKE
ncbi:hypothetical protein VNO80_22454 [Phaseolus coccineus]|uniref:Uncharacterized protein n=1 Tax=Phaseolus coccineus TaxID=3886 RepID=A0AAN9QU15_PHACN